MDSWTIENRKIELMEQAIALEETEHCIKKNWPISRVSIEEACKNFMPKNDLEYRCLEMAVRYHNRDLNEKTGIPIPQIRLVVNN